MEIQTDITKRDWVQFNLYHLSHSPSAKRRRLVSIFLPGLMWSGLWLGLSVLSKEPLQTIKALMPLIMGGPLSMLTILVLWRWNVSRQIQTQLAEGENRGVLGPQKIILSADGVAAMSELSQSTTRWRAVEKVVATDDCLYIYVSALSAVIVPKRSFSNENGFAEFVKRAKESHAQTSG